MKKSGFGLVNSHENPDGKSTPVDDYIEVLVTAVGKTPEAFPSFDRTAEGALFFMAEINNFPGFIPVPKGHQNGPVVLRLKKSIYKRLRPRKMVWVSPATLNI